MKPEFSEFSYGYAITEEIISSMPAGLKAAPVFPNLREEGQEGGGYDVRLNYIGYPIFLQFKISNYIKRVNTNTKERGIFTPIFYRMPIHSKRQSMQHELLIKLENKNEAVYYVAPAFHLLTQFDSYYLSKRICENSIFVRPQTIGKLPDNKEHHLSFKSPNNKVYFCSQPQSIGSSLDYRNFITELSSLIFSERASVLENFLPTLVYDMIEILRHLRVIPEESPFFALINENFFSDLRNSNYLQTIAYLARTYFNCEIMIVYREPS